MANINRNELAQTEKAMGGKSAEALADVELSEEELMQMIGGVTQNPSFSVPPLATSKRTGP